MSSRKFEFPPLETFFFKLDEPTNMTILYSINIFINYQNRCRRELKELNKKIIVRINWLLRHYIIVWKSYLIIYLVQFTSLFSHYYDIVCGLPKHTTCTSILKWYKSIQYFCSTRISFITRKQRTIQRDIEERVELIKTLNSSACPVWDQ